MKQMYNINSNVIFVKTNIALEFKKKRNQYLQHINYIIYINKNISRNNNDLNQ